MVRTSLQQSSPCRLTSLEVRSVHIPIERYGAVDLGVLPNLLRITYVLDAVSKDVRVRIAPDERPELHSRDESSEVVDLRLGVHAVANNR